MGAYHDGTTVTTRKHSNGDYELASLESQSSSHTDLIPLHESLRSSSSSSVVVGGGGNGVVRSKRTFSQKQRSITKTALFLSLLTIGLVAFVGIGVRVTRTVVRYTRVDNGSITAAAVGGGLAIDTEYYDRHLADQENGEEEEEDNNNENNENNNENNDNNNNENADNDGYENENCDSIFDLTESGSDEMCLFAKTCSSGQGLFLPFVFCSQSVSVRMWCIILFPFIAIWLVLLFRMLGSTAEDFFSPSLEMFSLKMGLPPRFAGVTLLALGNGAADVSATISAIVQNPENGYEMSIGALTGAGMFVGTVVAGMVVVTADGVKCRGALVRDVLMLCITTTVVYAFFEKGRIGRGAIGTFISMYIAFVLVVLIADVYHRKVVLPRIQRRNEEEEAEQKRNQSIPETIREEETDIVSTTGLTVAESGGGGGSSSSRSNSLGGGSSSRSNSLGGGGASSGRGGRAASAGGLMAIQESISVNDSTVGDVELTSSETTKDAPPDPDGLSRTPTPHPSNLTPPTTNNTKRKKSKRGIGDAIMVALSNYEKDEGKLNPKRSFTKGWGSKWKITTNEMDQPVRLRGEEGILNKHSKTDDDDEMVAKAMSSDHADGCSGYSALLDEVDQMCGVPGSTLEGNGGEGSTSERGGADATNSNRQKLRTVTIREQFQRGIDEFFGHFRDLVTDIFENEENETVDKFFLVCELPFTLLRKLTVPIPCEGYYCRTLVAVSLSIIPLWVASYALIQRNTNIFYTGEGYPNFAISMVFALIAGYMFLLFAPYDVNDLSLKVAFPIAFLGFLMAALWIDAIADLLVTLLTFLGVICGIPNNIMGLTVLAWGNSMGDLSANMTMAKKGLANMAITACFAGPVFNILVGLGGGFYQLNKWGNREETEVQLSMPNAIGFAFIMINCILLLIYGLFIDKGNLPKTFGYVALVLYVVYVITCVVLEIFLE